MNKTVSKKGHKESTGVYSVGDEESDPLPRWLTEITSRFLLLKTFMVNQSLRNWF